MKRNYHVQIVIVILLLSSLGTGLWNGQGTDDAGHAPDTYPDQFPEVENDVISDPDSLGKEGTRQTTFNSYHNYNETVSLLQELVNEHRNIASLHDLGDTSQGRDILAVKVSDDVGTDDPNEPDILYMGAHHGNEPISAEVPLYILDFLLSNYLDNGTVRKWIDTREIWFIPMVNPDGIEAGTRKNANLTGVDLNRNYGWEWGTQGASDDPYDITYRGEYSFSESETRAIRDLALEKQFTLSMSFHSYGQLVYYPWGNSIDTISPQRRLLENISSEIGERNGYMPVEANMDGTYITSGDSDDWLYSEGVLPFTIELSTVYEPPEHEILGICENNLASSLYLLDIADDPKRSQEDDWTFMVYMAGDNSLNSEALDDLNEMEVGGSTQDVNIIALFDGTTGGDSRIFQITKDPGGNNIGIVSQVIDDQGAVIDPLTNEVDMSSYLVLDDFVDWTMENYPAQRTALIIWDHGNGIFGGLAQDGINLMPTWDMRQALIGHDLDIVGMDLCWHGCVETAYELVGIADFFIGSIAEEPSDGWDYSAISEFLIGDPNSDAEALSREIVDSYRISTSTIPWATLSAMDMYLFEKDLIPDLNAFSIRLHDLMYNEQASIRAARSRCSVFDINKQYYADIGEFIDQLLIENISTNLQEYAVSLKFDLDRATIASYSGLAYPNIMGLGIYFPEQNYNNYYSTEFQFSDSDWVGFLPVFRSPVQTPVLEHDGILDVAEIVGTLMFNVTIIDDNLDTDELFINYRTGGSLWEKEALVGSGSSYSANITSWGIYGIDYYFSATDLTGNTITYPYGINLGSSEFLTYEMTERPTLSIKAIEHSSSNSTLSGDNFTIRVQIENQGSTLFTGVNVTLFILNNGSRRYLDDRILSIQAWGMANATFVWVAESGDHTLLMDLSFRLESLDNVTLDVQISDPVITDEFITVEELENELDRLWFGVIIVVVMAMMISMGTLMWGKQNVKKKKKVLAFKAIDNATYYVNSFADFGADISDASWKLEKAREALSENKYDSAYKLALEAKRSVDLDEMRNKDEVLGGLGHE